MVIEEGARHRWRFVHRIDAGRRAARQGASVRVVDDLSSGVISNIQRVVETDRWR